MVTKGIAPAPLRQLGSAARTFARFRGDPCNLHRVKWIRRILIAGLILLIVLIAGVIVVLRAGADRAELAQEIGTGGIVLVKNFSVDLYAAKTASTAIVFDAGLDPTGKAIDRLLEGIKVERESVSDLFITH